MTIVITANADIECGHSGKINIPAGTLKGKSEGNEIVTEDMMLLATFIGCTNVSGGNSPCTAIASITSGQAQKLKVSTSQAMLENMVVVTNGSINNLTTVIDPGQTKLDTV